MYRSRTIKKKTRNRNILLQNLKKGKARQESRCQFQLIPYPLKFASASPIYYLYADVVLMERQDTLISEASLFNSYKVYKNAQVIEYAGQKVVKIKVESKNIQPDEWRLVVEKLRASESKQLQEWSKSVQTFCERYESVVKELQIEQETMSNQRLQSLIEMNDKTEKTRQSIVKTYPCIEFKSQLKDGQIQVTEITVSEKYIIELGYTLETFIATIFQEGIPEVTPLNSPGAISIAKLRLHKYLTTETDSYHTPEFESSIIMKNGCMKKVKIRSSYLTCFEKGIPGFVFIGAIATKQKPILRDLKPSDQARVNVDFVDLMSHRETEIKAFLSSYYNQTTEQKYTDLDKICRIRELNDPEK